MAEPGDDFAALLRAARGSDASADDQLFIAAYEDLRQLARSRLRRSAPLTLVSPTTLVHETYLRLLGAAAREFPDSRHFLAYAARAMRSIVVDLLRQRAALRHGGGVEHITWQTQVGNELPGAGDAQALRVHEALHDLARVEPRLATVVELRYFGGLQDSEIADALDVTVRTVQRDWAKARLYLAAHLR
jgi:RNA polymerase sigma factor (TIGR02999 family)